MQTTPLFRVKNAIRFYNASGNTTWFIAGHPDPWGNDFGDPTGSSDSNVIQPALTVSSITSPELAAKATVYLVYEAMTPETITITSPFTQNDVIKIQIAGGYPNSPQVIQYTVGANPTATTVAAGVAAQINANSFLQAANITATSGTGVVTVSWSYMYGTLTFTNQSVGISEGITFTLGANPGTFTYNDANGNTRKYSPFPTPADQQAGLTAQQSAINNNCLEILLQGMITGAQMASTGATAIRQMGFATDLIPAVGYTNNTFLTAAQVSSWGQLESIHNRVPLDLDPESSYLCQHIISF